MLFAWFLDVYTQLKAPVIDEAPKTRLPRLDFMQHVVEEQS
jgi:hypothetical protein